MEPRNQTRDDRATGLESEVQGHDDTAEGS
jgi:hypothetical protein